MRVEHGYFRGGALAYVAALDVHRAKLFGRCESSTGIEPFDRLVAQVMRRKTYSEARRVVWIVVNGSSHRGQASVRRLENRVNDDRGTLPRRCPPAASAIVTEARICNCPGHPGGVSPW